jgi:hypothetical protein
MTTKPNNATVIDSCTKRLAALKAYVKNSKAEIAINGVVHKAADVIAIYQGCLNSRATLSTKRAEVKQAMNDRADAEDQRLEADRALKPWVINQFGAGSQQAVDFGFPPAKKAVRNVENKTHAVALALATREARGTKGKKQKLAIKGTLPVPTVPAAPAINPVTVAPVVASASSTAPVTPPATQAPPPQQASVASPQLGAAPQASPSVTNGAAPSH